ncbi:hypothetical protein SLEP1_g45664 [Rubroshorea leprosula]|uniref:Nodulation signaling pathway 2-like protein n=1 Tax=Rubroshorea leprosula TaxID=152421 RepID=A0AAV5LKL5_9ROSI|nr:hypothetical protein SLEP1_g45664 [Rubroshorea leprosula]
MAMAIDNNTYELVLSGYSTTTTTATSDDHDHNWMKCWSPVVDWEALSHDHNDYQDLIESVMDDESLDHLAREKSNSGSVSADTDTMLVDEDASADNFKGLRLVHLLIAAAEALAGGNESRELARVILVRLKELVSPKNGTNMERLAAYFTDALQILHDGLGGGSGSHGKHLISNGFYHRHNHHQTDVLSAFQLLQDMSPYVKFGHFTANQAILEAVTDEKRIHIVDYDIMEGIQWASLMQALVSRKDGPPVPHLRITALTRGSNGRRSIWSVQVTGRRLIAFAESIGQPFSFHQCRLESGETFKPSALKLVKGEALVMNCMLHLPHFSYRSPTSVASFLSGAKILNPMLVTLVEEDVGPRIDGGFVGRFIDSLHYYSAVYDSLEAGFPMQRGSRALVERVFLGPQIARSLGRIYRSRGEEEIKSWWGWIGGIGLKPMNISFANHCQAKLLVDLFNDGYRVEELGSNRLVLGWKSRRLLSASIWTSFDSDL